MSFFYMDRNAATIGFGTLTASVSTPLLINITSSSLGNITTSTAAYSSANQHELAFGSPDTNQFTTPGILTVDTAVNVWFKGITYQNLAGTQTINATGTGRIGFVGTGAYVNVTANGRLDITCPIQGTVSWEKQGSSILRLTAVNVFSAGMTIAAGTVEIANTSALGTGTVTMTGGKLSSSSVSNWFVGNAFSVSGTVSFLDATNTGYIATSGDFNIAAPTTMTLNAAQQLYVSGALNSTNSSATVSLLGVSGCTYRFVGAQGTFNSQVTIGANVVVHLSEYTTGTPNQFNGASSVTLNNSSNLLFYGNTGTTAAYEIKGASGNVWVNNLSSAGVQFTGATSTFLGAFRVYQPAVGATNNQIVLFSNFPTSASEFLYYNDNNRSATQTYKYTGSTNVATSAQIQAYAPVQPIVSIWHHAPSTSSATFTANGVLLSNAAGAHTFEAKNDATGLLSFTAGSNQVGAGAMSFSKTGTGPVALSGSFNHTGTVSVTAGTLNANSATALGAASSTAAISVTSGATLSLGAAPTYTTRSLTISGTGSSVAPNNGALIIANTGTSAFQSIALGATGTYIRATSSGSINAPFTTNNNSVVFGASAGSDFIPFASLSNVFSGTGSVTYGGHSLDTGIVRADVRHTYTGNTTLAYGTTYVDSSLELPATGGPLGNKSLTAANTLLMTGGTLSYLGGNVDYSGRFSTAGSQQWKIDAAGKTVTFATALVGASSLALSDTSTGGSLTLSSASSTFSGGVTITSGTLYAGAAQSGSSGPLGITGTITFAPAGTGVLAYTSASAAFDYSARFATTNGQTRRINVNGESVTFSTVLGGTNAFALVGSAGTLTLAAANTYTQGTTLSVGTLKCSNVQSLGTGASAGLAQANNTTLHVATVDGKMTITGAHTNTGTGSRIIRIGAA